MNGTALLATAVVPLVTALDVDGAPSAELVEPLLAVLHEAGISTLMLLGSNGEGAAIAPEAAAEYVAGVQRRWRAIAGANGRLLATAAGVSTADAVRRARSLAEAGAELIVAMPPLYFRHTEAELVAHLRAVAAVGPPTLVYDQPGYTGNPLSLAVYRALLADERIVGAKLSGNDPEVLGGLVELRDRTRPGFGIASGQDRGMIGALARGADGLVLGTAMLAPRACLDLIRAHRAGDAARAEKLQRDLEALLAIHQIRPGTSGIVATKTALDLLGRCPATATAPFEPFTATERARLREVLVASPIVDMSGH
jgi:dihydrodipicolinate synthase/N-acetylneuraminate lyase